MDLKRTATLFFLLLSFTHANKTIASDLVDNASVTALLNDFYSLDVIVVGLTPPTTPTYDCGGGNTGNNDNIWAFYTSVLETNPSPPSPQTNVEKVYALLNVAWLTGMKIKVEGVTTDCVPEYIILHNPSA